MSKLMSKSKCQNPRTFMSKRHKQQRLYDSMEIGYLRVSKHEQNEALQRDALQEAGCEKYFSDVMTGSKFERKGLEQLLAFMRSGDTVIVWKLDRLGRSLKDLIKTLNLLKEQGVDFISLTEH